MLSFHEEDETSILAGASKMCVKLLLSSVSQNMSNVCRLNLSVSLFLLYAESLFWTQGWTTWELAKSEAETS